MIHALVDEVVTVTDEQILAAMRFCFERCKLVVEPSGACALAAVLGGRRVVRRASGSASCCPAATSAPTGSPR